MRKLDLVGKVYGKLTVQELVGVHREQTLWLCVCECGNTVEVVAGHLRSGATKSCGCLRRTDLSGMVFDRLTVIEYAGTKYIGVALDPVPLWLCRCSCGNSIKVTAAALTKHNTRSCGCLAVDIKKANIKHGYARKGQRNSTYEIWSKMLFRCYNQNDSQYADYGGRGIYVCERWRHSFENFLEDMGEKPDGLTIDRIDNNGPYAPDNCRWATYTQQANNRRGNILVTLDGRTQTATEWGREIGLSKGVILRRLNSGYWTVEEAITTPVGVTKTGPKPNGGSRRYAAQMPTALPGVLRRK